MDIGIMDYCCFNNSLCHRWFSHLPVLNYCSLSVFSLLDEIIESQTGMLYKIKELFNTLPFAI